MLKDKRVEQAKKIISAIINKSEYFVTDVLIIGNTLVFVEDKTMLYVVELKDVCDISENNIIGFRFSDVSGFEDPSEYIMDYNIINIVSNYFNTYTNCINNCPVVYSDQNLTDNERFNELLNLKADEGLKFFNAYTSKMEAIHIPMFSGLISTNKQDTVGINVYDLLDNRHLLVNAVLFKKKINRTVHMYFRILKL